MSFFSGECPNCKKEFFIETKLFNNNQTVKISDILEISEALADKVIELKTPCSGCGKPVSFKMNKDKVLIQYLCVDTPDIREGVLGSLLPPEKSLKEQLDSMVVMLENNLKHFVGHIEKPKLWDSFKNIFKKRA